jgi:hypothetical protein
VHEALPLDDGSYQLNPKPLAQLGPGRVLGSKLDADGNLVMCDVLKVRYSSTSSSSSSSCSSYRSSNSWEQLDKPGFSHPHNRFSHHLILASPPLLLLLPLPMCRACCVSTPAVAQCSSWHHASAAAQLRLQGNLFSMQTALT